MKYKILQLKNLDKTEYGLRHWDTAKKCNFSLDDYELVYQGDLNNNNKATKECLELLFDKFNLDCPDDFEGHSLCVSDIIELDNIKYYCDGFGWQKLENL